MSDDERRAERVKVRDQKLALTDLWVQLYIAHVNAGHQPSEAKTKSDSALDSAVAAARNRFADL